MNEVGSEFWQVELNETKRTNNLQFFSNMGSDIKFLMSGRTAISYVLDNIVDNTKIVYFPEYGCNSMVQPFKDYGYQIKYYNVDLIQNKYFINDLQECTIFFAMSYFGYNDSNMDKHIKIFKKRNIVVLEDITHRLFCEKNHCAESDYMIASLRKWMPIYTGAIAINKKNKFKKDIDNYTVNEQLVEYKKRAMLLKRDYINDMNSGCKETFLDLFNRSNKLIADYKNRKMDDESLKILKYTDIEELRKRRIYNSKIIEEKIKNKDNVGLLYNCKSGDCPIFVPIILKNRNYIRTKLIENGIYCPIHWPKFNNSSNELYDKELSLICDQRYNEEDIKREVKIIFENI